MLVVSPLVAGEGSVIGTMMQQWWRIEKMIGVGNDPLKFV
jgi:hypothetical protein